MQLASLFSTLVNISAAISQKPQDASGCGLDNETGLPVGWKSTEISLDVVIVLDTSEAMGEVAVTDASILIDSLIGSADENVLVTDPRAEIFTRIGLIAVADDAQVLHSLNMTKADKVQGKVIVSKGVAEMDFEKAFAAAREMFVEGLIDEAERRKVIYFMTYSEPKPPLRIAEEFKSYGIVIANQLIYDYDDELPVLEKLASEGYYFTNAEDNYMQIIRQFCKANNSRVDNVKEWQLPSIPDLLSTSLIDTIRRMWRFME